MAGAEIGEHIATLNVFRETDGRFFLTFAGGSTERFVPDLGENPAQALATIIAEAGPRFVQDWRHWERKE